MKLDYVRLTNGLVDKGQLYPKSEVYNHITSSDQDWYISIFYYNESQYNKFLQTGTVATVTNVETDTLVFDFDSNELEDSRKDAIDLVAKLASHGLSVDDFRISFSGNKGFHVEIPTTTRFTVKEFKTLTETLASEFKSYDTKINNASRILRVANTINPKSGLYKIGLTLDQLTELTSDQIKLLAEDFNNSADWSDSKVELPESILRLKEANTKLEHAVVELLDLDLTLKPRNMPVCKYAILNGFFKSGARNQCLTALAAHFKAQGFPKEVTLAMLVESAKLQGVRENTEPVSEEELKSTAINSVYGPNWMGRTYSCKDHKFLQEICSATSAGQCKTNENKVITIKELSAKFRDFAKNIEKNKIYTGIEKLDKAITLTTSMSVGLLGAPGSGKSTIALNFMRNTSNQGIRSLFCSLDMGWPLVYSKLVSGISGFRFEKIIEEYKKDEGAYEHYDDLIADQYKNMIPYFKSGTSVDDIREFVLHENNNSDNKIKLVVIDYLELLVGPYSDPTANGAYQATKLKDLATDLELCVMVLVQPPKTAGDASTPLYSMRQIKGASALEQNFRAIIGIHREGFSPSTPEDDIFMTISGLKNTLGPLFALDVYWDGVTGSVRDLSFDEENRLESMRQANEETKAKSSSWD